MSFPERLLVFDIETVPDVASGRRLYDLDGLDDHQVAEVMFHRRRQQAGTDFLRPHLHRIIALSVLYRDAAQLRVVSLGTLERLDEAMLVRQFFEGVARHTPTLVSWNGGGFDLPVLHYRALLHGVNASRYWETGDQQSDFRYNSYVNRYHWRHTDLMDVLSGFQGRAAAPLDELAQMLGFPGKMGLSGDRVWEAFRAGRLADIRNYCDTDVLNTYLVYLRFERMRGNLDADSLAAELARVRAHLADSDKAHLHEFLQAWADAGPVEAPA